MGGERGLFRLLDRPRLLDAAVAAIALLAALGSIFYVAELVGWPLAVGLSIPPAVAVFWRQRAPRVVMGVAVVLSLTQWALAVPYGGAQAATLVALYTMARAGSHRDARIALGVVLVLAVISPLRQPYSDSVSSIFTALLVVLSYVLATNVELRSSYLRELEVRATRLERERDAAAEVAAAQERARIARELHDVVAHHVSVMVVQAEGAGWALGSDPDGARTAVATIADTGRSALTELRRLLGVLRAGEAGDLAPQPGLADLVALVAGFRSSGLEVEVEMGDHLENAPESLHLAAYRVVQESLTNVLKHVGQGAQVTVTIDRTADLLTVDVRDDGGEQKDPAVAVAPGSGHGLVGIRERAALFDGHAEYGPLPAGGFRVRVELPW